MSVFYQKLCPIKQKMKRHLMDPKLGLYLELIKFDFCHGRGYKTFDPKYQML